MKLSKFALFMLCVFLISCSAGKTNRVAIDTDEPFSDVETSSKDLDTVAQKMTASLLQLNQISNAKTPVRIAFADVKNETNEIINKNLFIEKMRTLLLKNAQGRMVFLDREISADIMKEREDKRAGQVSSTSSKMRSGADFFLTGKLASIDKVSGKNRSNYTRYSFRLTDAESTDILWEDDYEVKKVGESGLYDR
jgi:PBP1b-binding outer membrane lipoprotein LpoB